MSHAAKAASAARRIRIRRQVWGVKDVGFRMQAYGLQLYILLFPSKVFIVQSSGMPMWVSTGQERLS